MIYNPTDGLKYIMENKENSNIAEQFPPNIPNGAESFSEIFHNIEVTMQEKVHKHVVVGAAGSGDGILNDHGVGHIEMVEERAYKILGNRAEMLSGYEIFFLLLSIHFHDVGNILGREAHEEKIEDVFLALGDQIPIDNTAKRLIRDIAISHGGKVDGDKDTIAFVPEQIYIDGLPIRAAMLASILRYADEIADDKNRTSAFLLDVNAIPAGNKVFHEYSKALEPPVVEGGTLQLQYSLTRNQVITKTTKNDEEVYLYDEILLRVKKCLCELEYCRKYSQGFINLSCITVGISVYSDNGMRELYKDSFRLRISGYPDMSSYECQKKNIIIDTGEKLVKAINGG